MTMKITVIVLLSSDIPKRLH